MDGWTEGLGWGLCMCVVGNGLEWCHTYTHLSIDGTHTYTPPTLPPTHPPPSNRSKQPKDKFNAKMQWLITARMKKILVEELHYLPEEVPIKMKTFIHTYFYFD